MKLKYVELFEEHTEPESVEQKIDRFSKIVEEKIQVNLIEGYCSIGDDTADEFEGEYKAYEFDTRYDTENGGDDETALVNLNLANPRLPDISEIDDTPPQILIYESGKFQLYHDATPYPCSGHTPKEAKHMMQSLEPVPLPVEQITLDDVVTFLERVLENY